MSVGRPRRRPCLLAVPGLVLAVLALVSQLALGAVVLPDAAANQSADMALDALSVLCSADTPPVHEPRPPIHRHTPDGALCPMRVAVALHAIVLAAPPAVPPPAGRENGPAVPRLRAWAPPQQSRADSLPRGPPLLA